MPLAGWGETGRAAFRKEVNEYDNDGFIYIYIYLRQELGSIILPLVFAKVIFS